MSEPDDAMRQQINEVYMDAYLRKVMGVSLKLHELLSDPSKVLPPSWFSTEKGYDDFEPEDDPA